MVALDTGFFIAMMRGNEEAKELWKEFRVRRIRPIISVLTVGELFYILLKEQAPEPLRVTDSLRRIAKVINVDNEIVLKAGELKNRHKIPYVDSLIAATVLIAKCNEFITSDRNHMICLEDYGLKVKNIR